MTRLAAVDPTLQPAVIDLDSMGTCPEGQPTALQDECVKALDVSALHCALASLSHQMRADFDKQTAIISRIICGFAPPPTSPTLLSGAHSLTLQKTAASDPVYMRELPSPPKTLERGPTRKEQDLELDSSQQHYSRSRSDADHHDFTGPSPSSSKEQAHRPSQHSAASSVLALESLSGGLKRAKKRFGSMADRSKDSLELEHREHRVIASLRRTSIIKRETSGKYGRGVCSREILKNRKFDLLLISCILLNSVIIGVEVDTTVRSARANVSPLFSTLDYMFTSIFAMEQLLKLVVYGCREYFLGSEGAWNTFDFSMVAFSSVELVLHLLGGFPGFQASHLRILRIMRVARAFRGVRTLRLLRFSLSLRALVYSIANTLRSLAWTIVLLLMIFYVFGVAFTDALSEHCRDEAITITGVIDAIPHCQLEQLNQQWLSVPRSMLTLLKSISNGVAWEEVSDPLAQVSLPLASMFLAYFAFTFFAVLNVVTGVFCHNAISSSEREMSMELQMRNRQRLMQNLESIFQDIDIDGSQSITFDEVEIALNDDRLKACLESLDVDTVDAWTLFSLLDLDMSGCLDLDEFVGGLLNLRGSAKALQVAKMSHENKHMRGMLKQLAEASASILKDLAVLSRQMSLPDVDLAN